MCQMPNIWHICHAKYKNGALWDVPNLKNYTTWLQYRCKFATVRINVAKLLFPFLSPLSSFFLFSSLSLSGSFSLLPVPVPSLFDQSGMFIGSDDGALRHTRSHPHSATLDLAYLTPRPLLISPSSLSSLSTFHSASLWLWRFFFFGCNLG